jgi:hypothetical protein
VGSSRVKNTSIRDSVGHVAGASFRRRGPPRSRGVLRTVSLAILLTIGGARCAIGDAETAPGDSGLRDAATHPTPDAAPSFDTGADATADAPPRADSGTAPDVAAAPDASSITLLETYPGCPEAMYSEVQLVEEFDSATDYATRFTGAQVVPAVSSGALLVGPHPLAGEWWENFSSAISVRTFGDVLLCARWTLTPLDTMRTDTDHLAFGLRARGGNAENGVMLAVTAGASEVALTSRLADGTTQVLATTPFALTRGVSQMLELALLARGNHFIGEVRNVTRGAVVRVTADHSTSDLGAASVVGWRLQRAARVERVIVGPPSAAAVAALSDGR